MTNKESISVKTISNTENPVFDVVFLHGLNGKQVETWQHDNGSIWPEWLVNKFPDAGIHLVGYDASTFGKLEKIEHDLHERAESILQHLLLDGIGTRPLAMVCHSLGGITAKEILRIASESADDEWNELSDSVKLVIFFATPHKGAALANVAKLVIPRFLSSHVELLSGKSGYLASLAKSYSELSLKLGFKTEAFFEKYKILQNLAIVHCNLHLIFRSRSDRL
ncbi:MAG: alpha/beta fold hydrolase [Pseudomonadota bacterium]|nr:alpha/beta fold hydrolase [Pseudomonadota bacterium]